MLLKKLNRGLSFHLISQGRHINISSDWIRGITSPICSYFQISTHIRSFIIKKSHYHRDVKNTPALGRLCPHLMSAFQQDLVVLKLFVFLVVSQCQCQCSQVCSLFCIFALISFPGPRLAISFLSKQPNLMFWWNIQIRAIYTKIMAIKIYVKTKVSESCFKLNAHIYIFFSMNIPRLLCEWSSLPGCCYSWKLFWLCRTLFVDKIIFYLGRFILKYVHLICHNTMCPSCSCLLHICLDIRPK